MNEARPWSKSTAHIGATVMGRNMFGGHPGPWDREKPWNGWWGATTLSPCRLRGDSPSSRPLELEGGTSFTFVTGGIEAALVRRGGPPQARMFRWPAERRQHGSISWPVWWTRWPSASCPYPGRASGSSTAPLRSARTRAREDGRGAKRDAPEVREVSRRDSGRKILLT